MTSPTLFNVAVYSVFWNWLFMTVKDDLVFHGSMGHVVGQVLGEFNAGDGLLGLRDPEWLQGGINILIGPFLWIGLMDNVAKSKPINCQLGEIWLGMSEEEVGW